MGSYQERKNTSMSAQTLATLSNIASPEKVDLTSVLAKSTADYGDPKSAVKKLNFLIYGEAGVGKTPLLATYPGRVLMFSFDPGGTQSVRQHIGTKIFPILLENENIKKPDVMDRFTKKLDDLGKNGVYDELAAENGVLSIDSLTSLERAGLRKILMGHNRQLDTPSQPDYGKAMTLIENILWQVLNLPCNVILLAHQRDGKDDFGRMFVGPLLTGKSSKRVPNIISEIYYMGVKADGTRFLKTSTEGVTICRSRLNIPNAKGERPLSAEETPNLEAIIKKSGWVRP